MAIRYDKERAQVLAALSANTDIQQTAQIWQAVRDIHNTDYNNYRVQILESLQPRLDAAQRAEALKLAMAIDDFGAQVDVLRAVTPYLSVSQRDQALQIAIAIGQEHFRSQALSALASHLEANQLEQALHAAIAIEEPASRSNALAALAARLGPSKKQNVLDLALQSVLAVGEEWSRCEGIANLAPQLEPGLRQRVLDRSIREAQSVVGNYWSKIGAIVAIAPLIDSEPRKEVLTRAFEELLRVAGSPEFRSWSLGKLFPHLDIGPRALALDAAIAIRDVDERADALVDIAPHAVDHECKLVLEAAPELSSDASIASILSALSTQLDPEQAALALKIASSIGESTWRARAHVGLIQHIAYDERERMLKQCQEVAMTISDLSHRCSMLTNLIHVTEGDLLKVTMAALLSSLPDVKRSAALRFASGAVPAIVTLGGSAAIADFSDAIFSTVGWYP